MKSIVLSLLVLASLGLSSCSVHQVKKNSTGEAGATIVKISPFMAWLVGMKSELKENGIESLKGIEVITTQDPGLSAKYAAEVDEEVGKKKLESAMKVRDEEAEVDMFVRPVPHKESLADALIIKVQESEELTIVKIRGRINFAKMIANMEKEEGDNKGKKKRIKLGIVTID